MGIAKWRKIDFHTHTPASRCFKKEVTPEEWVNAVVEAKLDAVVVTDHNSVDWIGKLREVIRYRNDLFLFPGVELCVGNSFTHILVIFDPQMDTDEIESFVIKCGLSRNVWGDTTKTVKEDTLAELKREYSGKVLIVPAHFNSNKGICQTLNQNGIKEFYDSIPFDAIEVRNGNDLTEVNNKIRNRVFPEIAVITGSDNPGKSTGEHCITGFGNAYTWVKISEFSLEALRQVFMDYQTRSYIVLNSDDEEEDLNEVHHNYISGMIISNLKHVDELNFKLSPHLNCIIGGRGTGKSTVIEMSKLALSEVNSWGKMEETSLFKTYTDESKIKLFYNFGFDKPYCINVEGKKNQKLRVEDNTGFITDHPAFPVSIYSQKELFSLVEDDNNPAKNETSPLLKIIDENISLEKAEIEKEIDLIKKELLFHIEDYLYKRNQIKEIPILKAEIELNHSKLSRVKDTGIIEKRKELNEHKKPYSFIENILKMNESLVENIINDFSEMNDKVNNDMDTLLKGFDSYFTTKDALVMNKLKKNNNSLLDYLATYKYELSCVSKEIRNLELKKKIDDMQINYTKLLEELGTEVDEYTNIENLLNQQNEKVRMLCEIEKEISSITQTIKNKIKKYIEMHMKLTTLRSSIVEIINEKATNIKLHLYSISHFERWIYHIRKELGKENSFEKDFNLIVNKIFTNEIADVNQLEKWFEFIILNDTGDIRTYINHVELNDNRFNNIWTEKRKDKTLHSLINFVPEDRLEIKIMNGKEELNINEGSPGQKTAAILTFILNQGKNPLIIDQPEDDLDNSLIRNLIVENIRKIKTQRQIIIATHNPNIPVLGDAEGIIMLDRNKEGFVSFKDGKKTGCIEEKTIKKGICDIMEGGIDAFKKREGKYRYVQS